MDCPGNEPKKFILLDRDGTIIIDKVYLSDPNGIKFSSRAIDGLRLLQQQGFILIIITNQSGIARGYFDIIKLEAIHKKLLELLEDEGIFIEKIYYCPHAPEDNCECRKPRPGMLHGAMNDFGFGPKDAVFIGDSESDILAAAAVGIKGIKLIKSTDEMMISEFHASDFLEAAEMAINLIKNGDMR